MQNNSEIKRPPKPNWGNEVTVPSESCELINENIYKFSVNDSENQHVISDTLTEPSRNISPTEEYLQMTRRLIESKSLSPRTSMVLEKLYATYESIRGYGPASFDPKNSITEADRVLKDSTETIELDEKHEETDKSQTFAHPRKVVDGTNLRRESKAKPSTSNEKQFQSSTMNSRKSPKLEQKKRITKIPVEDPEPPWFALQTVPDSVFEEPCDPETIKINNIFSEFSLSNVGHDKALKQRISEWMMKEGRLAAIASANDQNERERGSSENIGQRT